MWLAVLLPMLALNAALAQGGSSAPQFGAPPPEPPPLAAGTLAPDFTTRTLSGQTLTVKSLRGHVAVLDFWATWCVSCKEAMPALQKLQRDYRAKGVRIVGMSLDTDNVAQVRPVAWKLGVTYTITADPRANLAAGRSYNADVLPCVYILDKRGVVRWSYSGLYDGMDKDMRALLDKLTREK